MKSKSGALSVDVVKALLIAMAKDAMGPTDAGRYLVVFFIQKAYNVALILSARDMDSRNEGSMKAKDNDKQTPISKAQTLDEVAEYWDAHSLADHWDETREAQFEVRAKRRRRITVDPEVYSQIEVQARSRGISPETLVNLWLAERIKKEEAA